MIWWYIFYGVMGLYFAGLPTFLDLKDGLKYNYKDWLSATGAFFFWPLLSAFVYFDVVINDL